MVHIQGVSQQESTKQVVSLAAGTLTSSLQLHGSLSAVRRGTHLGACKTHEIREVK